MRMIHLCTSLLAVTGLLCLPGAESLAGEPSIKGKKLLDDGKPALTLVTRNIPGGATQLTISDASGQELVLLMLSPYSPDAAMLNADFRSLGLNFGGSVPEKDAGELVLSWWRAGALSAEGANAEGLQRWCQERNFTLNNTAAQQASFAAAMASRPPPAPAPAPAAPPPASESPAAAPPAKPSAVSVELHVSCSQRVRLFFGSSPNSGGTYGWESSNSTRSTTLAPGSVICITDDHDKVQSCWTVGEQRARLDVSCGGFTVR